MLPLAGDIEGLVISATPVAIHGDRYIDLMLQTPEQEGTDHATRLRVAEHAIAPGTALTPGRRVRVSFLMQQVTAIEGLGKEEVS
ncbi:MAG: hypothetical protein K2X32_14235 [Phycisphaerales bacterium]|nr:hypothetical protein [Phycisphaerales bacterium]